MKEWKAIEKKVTIGRHVCSHVMGEGFK